MSTKLHCFNDCPPTALLTVSAIAIRVRPPLQPEDPGYDLIPQRFRKSTCEVTTDSNISIQSSQGKKLFVFDRVFGEGVDQAGVWTYISESVDSFVQGYNVSIMAYGQSGAGKSYTMGTSDPDDISGPALRGIVPRAAASLFEKLEGISSAPSGKPGLRSPQRYSTIGLPTLQSMPKLGSSEKSWQLKATYVEIYNEQLRDLLLDETTPLHERPQVTIREDTKGRILLTGLKQIDINSPQDLLDALRFGSAIRQTDATAINAKSSRSHAVFSLNLIQKKSGQQPTSRLDKRRSVPVESLAAAETTITTDSKLHFVDLAGSERLKNTGAQGDKAKEGISINAGLASLGKVIAQLSSRSHGAHISYRDSRLTRLLQDSLGGNAITYLIACVNPAEFHLSETLNTVHYAQRARAIQSKPEIQQMLSESDKTAQIERLKAEVAFLRDQIRTEKPQPKSGPSTEISDARALEIQNQLIDMQEAYQALNQRHEKMIMELGKSSDEGADDFHDSLEGSATDRLQRSSSFAAAVENVVLEYEKTIQSLESSLTNTRSTLSNTESTLMERESRIAYLEAAGQQSQTRLRKMMDREQHTEQYLQELESKLENVASSEESTASLVSSLRKELSRAKENQTSTEDYISALEQRLSEAEQDHGAMKRELERLEQMVDRQRNIGLVEKAPMPSEVAPQPSALVIPTSKDQNPAIGSHLTDPMQPSVRSDSPPSPLTNAEKAIVLPEVPSGAEGISPTLSDGNPAAQAIDTALSTIAPVANETADRNAAQTIFMADKLETLTQELFDLQGEHETTLSELDQLKRKYAVALASIEKNHKDGSNHAHADLPRSDSFLGQGTPGLPPQHSGGESLQFLASDSSSQSGTNISASMDESTAEKSGAPSRTGSVRHRERSASDESETPMTEADGVNAPCGAECIDLQRNHEKLIGVHREALIEIDMLKAELQKSHERTPSPVVKSPLVRRKPSQDMIMNLSNNDRANRAFASLRNIALDQFESNPDVRQNFELQLTTLMMELHTRTERAQQAESDTMTLRKQLEEKVTIIAGLTRERSTFKASPAVDFSAVTSMRDQLLESEQQIRMLHEGRLAQEQEFQTEIANLKSQIESHVNTMDLSNAAQGQSDLSKMKQELSAWQTKHNETLASVQASEARLLVTVASLEQSLASAAAQEPDESPDRHNSDHHDDLVDRVQKMVERHLAAGRQQTQKLSDLETMHGETLQQLEKTGETTIALQDELKQHRILADELQQQLACFEASTTDHSIALDSLKEAHGQEVDRLQTEISDAHANRAVLQEEHRNALTLLENELKEHQASSASLAEVSMLLGESLDHLDIKERIHELVHLKNNVESRGDLSTDERRAFEDEIEALQSSHADLENVLDEVKILHDAAMQQVEAITKKEQLSARLVQELEDQLNNNYDQTQLNNNRLSEMQSERQLQFQEAVHARMELEKEVEDSRLRISYLEAQLNEARRRSNASMARDSSNFFRESLSPEAAAVALARSSSTASTTKRASPPLDTMALPTALPSPPPAIPLPPLPTSPIPGSLDMRTVSPPPTQSRPHTPHRNIAGSPISPIGPTRQLEEQEARIRTVEKHLFAEKQLTATLEEALVDLETAQNKTRQDLDTWRRKAIALEDELIGLRKQRSDSRASLQQVEEEREMRVRAERARRQLEEQMRSLEMERKKKKKSALNCF